MAFIRNLIHKLSGRHVLTSEDRQAAAELNAARFRIRREEMERQAEINRLRDQRLISKLTEGDQEGQALMAILAAAMSSNQQRPALPEQTAAPQPLHLSNEAIEEMLKQLPKPALKAAKVMPVADIKQIVLSKVGPVDEDTLGRIVNRVKA